MLCLGSTDGSSSIRSGVRSAIMRREPFAVLVGELRRIPLHGQRLDELLGDVDLPLRDGVWPGTPYERSCVANLVAEEQRLERENPFHRPERDEVRLGSEHEPADPNPTGLRERPQEQAVGLLRPLPRRHVVGLLEVHRVDLLEPDEVLEVDHPARRRPRTLDLLGLEEHVGLGLDLVAPDEILVRDLGLLGTCVFNRIGRCGSRSDVLLIGFPQRWAGIDDPSIPDVPPLLVEQLEPHVLRLGRRVQRDGDRDEPEAERSLPDRPGHGSHRSERSARASSAA